MPARRGWFGDGVSQYGVDSGLVEHASGSFSGGFFVAFEFG